MGKKLFKVRDKTTGKFWNGDVRRTTFGDTGQTWKTKDRVESQLSWLVRYRASFGSQLPAAVPENWEIVEVELKEVENATHELAEFLNYIKLKTEAEKSIQGCGNFMEIMRKKGVLKDIEFIFELKPAEGSRYVDFERIKECRAHLRQLGVKTRTFREHNGMFGMMDRQQALRARMVLDVKTVVDLATLRDKL